MAKKPGEKWANSYGEKAVPNKEHHYVVVSNGTFFPGYLGMKNIGQNGSEGTRNNAIYPQQVFIIEYKTVERSENNIVGERKSNANDNEFYKTSGGFRFLGLLGGGLFHIEYYSIIRR